MNRSRLNPRLACLIGVQKVRGWREVREREKIWTNCSPLAVSLAHISVRRPKNLNSWNRLTIVRILKAVSFASCPNILLVFRDCAVSFTALQLRVNPQIMLQIIGISVKSSTLNRANNNLNYVPNLSSLTTLKVPGGYLGLFLLGMCR